VTSLPNTVYGVVRRLDDGYAVGDADARLTVSRLRQQLGSPEVVSALGRGSLPESEWLCGATALSLFATHRRPGAVSLHGRSLARACSVGNVNERRIERLLGARDLSSVTVALRPIVGVLGAGNVGLNFGRLADLIFALSTEELADTAAASFAHDYITIPTKG